MGLEKQDTNILRPILVPVTRIEGTRRKRRVEDLYGQVETITDTLIIG